MHEAKMWPHNSFITLTYDPKNIPESGSVDLRELQLFMKRLRKSTSNKVRFFACGEYGGLFGRPHYHAIVFNQFFDDRKLFTIKNGNRIYTSEKLKKLWTNGFSTIGAVNFKTAAYCAQYTIKKITGEAADDHYTRPHCLTGKLVCVNPEFATMSTKPGIGSTWYEQFKSDLYPSDFCIVDGRKKPIPKYYDLRLKKETPEALEKVKRRRKAQSLKSKADQTRDRLAVREEVLTDRVNRQKRVLGDYS